MCKAEEMWEGDVRCFFWGGTRKEGVSWWVEEWVEDSASKYAASWLPCGCETKRTNRCKGILGSDGCFGGSRLGSIALESLPFFFEDFFY